ncbi:MAG TPA: HAMP domain-containing sensor histidine kinase [Chloroflexota bacterium]|nr:HAMP domain-containing sensor histidine kinase [Chloroflexota bacterium]
MRRRALSLRLWLALALLVIIGLPALTTWGLANLSARRPLPEQVEVSVVQRVLQDNVARWRDPAWQRRAERQFAAMGTAVQVVDSAGRQVFVTPGARAILQRWARLGARPRARPRGASPLGALVAPTQLFTTIVIPSAAPRSGELPALGLAYLWLTPRPPSWIQNWGVPLSGLVALLLALAIVTTCLRRLVLRPLAALVQAMRRIAAGDHDIQAPTSRAAEVTEVSAGLAAMSAALREALERQRALEQERKLFISAVAHDLRTPLFMLRGYLEGLETRVVTTPEKVAAYVRECRAKADALEHLIADLFAYATVDYLEQEPRRDPLDLGVLIQRVIQGRRLHAEVAGVALMVEGPGTPCPCVGDAHLLTRAIENLLENAERYTPRGGVITVSWGAEGTSLVVRVADTGPGIAAQDLPHLFTPLYRGETSRNREAGGAGLGLTIARRIMQAHGGDLWAANRASGGAIFTGTLPLEVRTPPRDAPSTTCADQ